MKAIRAFALLALAHLLRICARGPLWLANLCAGAATALETRARL